MIGLILYAISKKISPKGKDVREKYAPYACGEDFPPIIPREDIRLFFVYVALFLAFDIAVFLIMASVRAFGLYPILYLLITLASLALILHIK